MNGAAALGAHSEDHGPAVGRWLEQHCILRRNVRPAARKGVEIGRVERCIGLPKTYGLTSRHGGKPGALAFPDTSKRYVIMQVAPDGWQLLQQRDTDAPQLVLIANAGLHQQLR